MLTLFFSSVHQKAKYALTKVMALICYGIVLQGILILRIDQFHIPQHAHKSMLYQEEPSHSTGRRERVWHDKSCTLSFSAPSTSWISAS